tara:strand:- start:192 stop:1106 length:915 start_codon:yes stop_codon:yes gene_type:complete
MEQLGGYSQKLFKEDHCSPSSNNENTCLDDDLIHTIGKGVNKIFHKKKKFQEIDLNQPTQKIHEDICKNLNEITGCSSESCWMNIKKLMKYLGKDKERFIESFKPVMPQKWVKDYNTWLRTDDIEKCLDQYDDKYKDFHFYGAVPIDFHKCSVSDLCSINLKDHIDKGHKRIGIVFNTDPHDEPGQHWISMYIDIFGKNMNNIPGIYYFDSYGDKPGKEVKNLVNTIKEQGSSLNKDFKFLYNDHPFQKKDYQCGMYSIFFINEMLKQKSFKKFLNQELTDQKMKEKRKDFFLSPKEIKCKYSL